MHSKPTTMKKRLFIFVILNLLFCSLFAQESTLSAGGDTITPSGSVSYSVGQLATKTEKSIDNTVYQGVQTPYEISIITGAEEVQVDISVSVYPNPMTDVIQLTINEANFENYSCQVYNVQSKKIYAHEVDASVTKIDLSAFPPSTYYLKVMQNEQVAKTYKLIKR